MVEQIKVDKYIKINVREQEAQIVGEKDIIILEEKPSSKINVVSTYVFLFSNTTYKDINIEIHTSDKTISGIHVSGLNLNPVPY